MINKKKVLNKNFRNKINRFEKNNFQKFKKIYGHPNMLLEVK